MPFYKAKSLKLAARLGREPLGCKVTEVESSAVLFHSQYNLIFIDYNIIFSLLIVFNDFDTTTTTVVIIIVTIIIIIIIIESSHHSSFTEIGQVFPVCVFLV